MARIGRGRLLNPAINKSCEGREKHRRVCNIWCALIVPFSVAHSGRRLADPLALTREEPPVFLLPMRKYRGHPSGHALPTNPVAMTILQLIAIANSGY
jgi:hypothetical protein